MANSDYMLIEFQDAFDLFSKDGNINGEGLKNILKALEETTPTPEEIKTMFEVVDSDGDGWISFEEFMKIIKMKLEEMEDYDTVRQAFQSFDENGEGIVSTGSIHHALTNLGETIPEEEVKSLLEKFEETKIIPYDKLLQEYELDVSEYIEATKTVT